MPVKITIIGLGQIGASIGMALGEQKESIQRIGNDKSSKIEREALELGAIDEVVHNLPSAVRDARLVILCIPLSQVKKILDFISQDLQAGTVLLDTAPIKAETFKEMKDSLPDGVYYIGLVPALNPAYLHSSDLGLNSAKSDLFQKGVFFIDVPQGVPEAAVTLACDFVRLLGATPLLADPAESDGIMAAVHLLPQLAGAALLNATVDQPGWQEGRKLAGRAFASVTGGLAYHDEITSLSMSVLQNRENIIHALDVFIAALTGIREEIQRGDETGVDERLKSALKGHQRWLNERYAANWRETTSQPVDVPSFAERLFGTGVVRPKHK